MKQLKWIIVLLFPGTAFGQILTLQEAVKLALENNFDVQVAANTVEVSRLQNNPGAAGMLPAISLNGNASYGISALRQEFANGLTVNNNSVSSRVFGAGAALDWTVFDGLRMFAVKKRLAAQEGLSAEQLRESMLSVTAEVIQLYARISAETEQLATLEKSEQYFAALVDLAENRQRAGTGNRQEVLQAKTDHNARKSAILQQKNVLRALQVQMNLLLNRPPQTVFQTEVDLPVNRTLTLDKTMEQAVVSNPRIAIADQNMVLWKQNVREWQSFQMPRLSVNAGYNFNYSGNSAGFALFNQTNGFIGGARLAFPIFDGWQVRRNISAAKVQFKTAELGREFAALFVSSEVVIAFETYQNQLDVLALEEENIRLAEENYQIAESRYGAGLSNLLEVRAAALSLEESRTRHTRAKAGAKEAETNLLRISGELVK